MSVCGLKVLVVGGAGYIGSHTVRLLKKNGADVTVLDNFSTGKRHLAQVEDVVEGDLGDRELLGQLFKVSHFDAVMHFAAFSIVGESVRDPLKYYQNNVAKTAVLLDAMVKNKIDNFIFSSTAAVYGEPEKVPIEEDHPCKPKNPYGSSKLMVETIIHDAHTAFGLDYAILRYFNAAGADPSGQIGECHEPETHLIPIVLETAAGKRKEVKLFGSNYPTPDGTCIRDYIHVNDLAQAHILALMAILDRKESCIYNLGNGKGYSVRQVIQAARKVTKRRIMVVEKPPRDGDPAVLIAGSDKIKRELGWNPAYGSLETIVETAWRWHNRK